MKDKLYIITVQHPQLGEMESDITAGSKKDAIAECREFYAEDWGMDPEDIDVIKIVCTHPIYESPKKEEYIEKFGDHADSCICCGKPTVEKRWIHAITDWLAVDVDDSDLLPSGRSQGYFPVGSECAKKFPKSFIFETPNGVK